MPNTSKRSITVVGAGFMGTVIATLYARHGYKVLITDTASESLETFGTRARPIAASIVEDEAGVDAVLANIDAEASLEDAVRHSFFVHEAIHENLQAKQQLFSTLDRICDPDVVLATNTSSYRLSELCKHVGHRDRIIGVHYITPAHIINVVELIVADFTPAALVEWGHKFLGTIGHIGVVCTDTPGFLVNRLQYALLSEVYRVVEEGVASRDDVDKAIRLSLGPRLALWGALLTEDLVVSKKTTAAVWDYLHQATQREIFQQPAALNGFVESGRLGAIAGAGWYRFGEDYASIVASRDAQLKALLSWLAQNDRISDFEIS